MIDPMSILDPAVSASAFDLSSPLVVAISIIASVLLVIVIMFLSYFTILRAIAAYSYSNARFKAVGTPYLSKTMLETLSESSGLLDISSRLAEHDFRIPQTPRISIEELEEALESEIIRMLRNALAATPDGSKPFFRAYLVRFDALQIKKALRGTRSKQKVAYHPAYHVSAETIRLLSEITSSQEVAEIVGDNLLGAALSEAMQREPEKPVTWELALDKAVFENLYSSVALVDDEIKEPIKEFYGRMADVNNINMLARAKKMNISPQETLSLMVPGGREFSPWKLEQMAESQDHASLMSELDISTYGKYAKEKGLRTATPADLEYALDHFMLTKVTEIASKTTLLAGPALRFAYGKEREARNIMAVARAVMDRVSFAEVEPYLVAEDS